MMKKISVSLLGHRTSISLESEFLAELQRIANRDGKTVAALIAQIDESRNPDDNLSSAVRVYVLGRVMRDKESA